jgi:hypothetical protein
MHDLIFSVFSYCEDKLHVININLSYGNFQKIF